MKKRIFASFMAIALLAVSSFTVSADYVPGKEIDPNVMSTKMATPQFKVAVNGSEINAPAPFEKEDGTLMLPLRAFTEAFGFTVEWQGETGTIVMTKGPQYITMSAFADGYTFAKTAPMLLGTAPILTDGVTYVPSNFVTDILGGAFKIEMDGTIHLYDAESANVALVNSVNAEEKQILVNDITKGEVVLVISDETTITDEEGNPFAFESLEEGHTLKITYGEAMTMSIPPINNPSVIVVKSGSPAMPIAE